jgi:hypothetical protein
MALSASLEAELGQDGFTVTGTLDATATDVAGIEIPAVPLDASAIAEVAGRLGSVDPSALGGAVEAVVGALRAVAPGVPAVGDLLAPLSRVIEEADRFSGTDLTATMGAIVEASGHVDGAGLDALVARVAGLGRLLRSEPVVALTDLVLPLIPGGLDADRAFGSLGADARGVELLVRSVGVLMAVESATHEIAEGSLLVVGMMEPSELEEVAGRLREWATQDLAGLLQGVDPSDPQVVDVVAEPILAMCGDVRLAADVLTRGVVFGHGALVGLDIPALTARLEAASALVSEEGLDAVRALAERVVGALHPALSMPLPDAAGSLEAMWAVVEGHLASLAGRIEAIDVADLTAGVTGGLTNALSSIGAFTRAAEEVVVAARSAFETVREAIASVDLSPVTDAIDAALAPILSVVDEITALVGDAATTVEDASAAVIAAMDTVRASVQGAADAVAAAFGRVDAVVTALDLANLQTTIRAAIEPITVKVDGFHVAPAFATAVDVIDTIADVVAAVPLGLLPDDARQELADAVEPVKSIDFQVDVADVLNARLQDIVGALDTDVLGAVEEAYGEVVAFLRSVDPSTPIEQLEAEVFEPFLQELRSINPTELLGPLEEAIAPVRDAIASFDIGASLLDPIEGAIDKLKASLGGLDPAVLLGPIQAEIEEARAAIRDALHLDVVSANLDAAEAVLAEWFERADLTGVVDAVDAWFAERADELVTSIAEADVLGTVLAGLMEGSGFGVRADALDEVRAWIGGGAAGTVVQGRLSQAAASLEALLGALASFDLGALVAGLQPRHRALRVAVEALPADSPLRLAIDVEVAGAMPLEVLGPFVDAAAAYRTAVGTAATSVRRAAGSARSRLDALTRGLREALRPLTAIADWLRSIATRSGLDPAAPPGAILLEVLTTLTPSRMLTPVVSALTSLLAKVRTMAAQGILGPVREAVADVEAALAAIDIGFIATELSAIQAEVVASLDGVRPSVVLADAIAAFEGLQSTLSTFDPLGAVRAAVEAMTDAVEDAAEEIRPTHVFAPVVETYRGIVDALGALNVRVLLDPLLLAIDRITLELGTGLDETAVALGHLQDALPDAGSIAAGAVGGSVSVSASLG